MAKTKKTPPLEIKMVELDELVRWPKNPKNHDWDLLGTSIKKYGFVQPLTVDEGTGRLVAGHGRLEMLMRMKAAGDQPPDRIELGPKGQWMVPVIRGIKFDSEEAAQEYLLIDNRAVEKGGWDDRALLEQLGRFDEAALTKLGFNEDDMALLRENAFIGGLTTDGEPVDAEPPMTANREELMLVVALLKKDHELVHQALKRAKGQGAKNNPQAVVALADFYLRNTKP